MKLFTKQAELTVDLKAGGRLSSFVLQGHEILVPRNSDPFGWGCYPMIPWAGRIRNGLFDWEGRRMSLPINMEPHAIHGTLYNAQWTQIAAGVAQKAFTAPWDFPGYAQSRFELSDHEFVWTIEVHAESKPMPCIVGWHPWFLRDGNRSQEAAISFAPETMYERDKTGIPTGRKIDAVPRPWDDCFENTGGPVTIQCAGGLDVEVSSDCSHWVIYDEPEHAYCIEPQSGPPNGFNFDELSIVRPGEPLVRTMTWRW